MFPERDSIDRACEDAAKVTEAPETCCFCGKAISPYVYPDRDVTGRVAHFTCSTGPWQAGDWVMAANPWIAEYEEEDDGKAWEAILYPGRRVGV